LQCLASAVPKSVMPSGAKKRKVSKEEMRKNLAVLTKTPRLNHLFFSKTFKQQRQTSVGLTRAPENVGENHDISFEVPFTLSLAGHIDMLFFWCFFVFLVSAYCSGECCFLPSVSLSPVKYFFIFSLFYPLAANCIGTVE